METKKVLTRENIPTDELETTIDIAYKGVTLKYNGVLFRLYCERGHWND